MYVTMYIRNAQYVINYNDKAPLYMVCHFLKMKGKFLQFLKEPAVCVTPRAFTFISFFSTALSDENLINGFTVQPHLLEITFIKNSLARTNKFGMET